MATLKLDWFPVWQDGGYAEIRYLKGRSGVYLLRSKETHELLYIGESHTGKIYETITRHFQEWSGRTAGTTYGKHTTEIAIVIVPPSEAQQLQYDLIAENAPRDNVVGNDDDDGIPF